MRDDSALTTGVLLGLTLPPAIPLWMAFLGGVAGIGLGKLVWGGLGQNLFNPALVGRAFLQAAFPTAITTWAQPAAPGSRLALPESLFAAAADGAPASTRCRRPRRSVSPSSSTRSPTSDPSSSATRPGRSARRARRSCLLCGLWLGARRIFDWRLPVCTLLSVAVLSGVLHWLLPESAPPPSFMLFSGGLLFAGVFMVTDPVTTPTTPRGAWLFGVGVGALVVLIRLYGGPPGRRDVRDPADERGVAPHQPPHPAPALRSPTVSAPEAGPLRMMGTLGLAGMCSGLAIVGIFLATPPRIERNRAEALEAAIFRVLDGARSRVAYVLRGADLVPFESPDGGLPKEEAVYAGYDEAGALLGFAIPAEGAGFQDTIKLIYGFDASARRVVGMEVLESRETPGLGDKIIKDADFVGNFRNLAVDPHGRGGQGGTHGRQRGRCDQRRHDLVPGGGEDHQRVERPLAGPRHRADESRRQRGRARVMAATTSTREDFVKGLWRENPVFVQLLGLCPALAVTNSAINALAMGAATTFVLVGSSLLVSSLRRWIPKQVRITTFIIVIATFVTVADFSLQALAPDDPQGARRLHRADRRQLPDPGAPGGLRLAPPAASGRRRRAGDGGGLQLRAVPARGHPRDPRQRFALRGVALRRELRALGDHDPAAGRLPHPGPDARPLRPREGAPGAGEPGGRVRSGPAEGGVTFELDSEG